MGDCRLCGEKAGFLRKVHGECESIRANGLEEMTNMAARAVLARGTKEAQLRSDLLVVARRSYVSPNSIDAVIAEAWHRAVGNSFSDGILTAEEEARLLEFRNRFAISGSEVDKSLAALEKGARDRVMLNARLLALTASDTYSQLDELQSSVRSLRLSPDEAKQLLIQAWVAAVEGSMEDGILTQAEENALFRYMAYFNFSRDDVEDAHRDLVRAAVIRDLMNGEITYRLNVTDHPFNLQKSEKLVWAFRGVQYIETKTKRERRGTSHGVSIRVARGLYYRPSTFKSRVHEWDENVHVDTGILGVTPKHLYFSGPVKSFRVRYDKIVAYDAFSDGIGFTQDAGHRQTKEIRNRRRLVYLQPRNQSVQSLNECRRRNHRHHHPARQPAVRENRRRPCP